ncbi:MAG TPA: hypothetical protein VFE47_06050 [Tepidisphaeraceae bacterium]|jgi:hypothetical protein|nr:hypothetical protein [Tepidisphaeraceae bacterium]
MPTDSRPILPAATLNYHAYGIGRNDDHSAAFAGKFASPGGTGTPPAFDVAVADLEISAHEITQSDGNGLALAPSMITGQFPAPLPGNVTPITTTFNLTPRWKGPPNPDYVGYIAATVGGHGVAVYDQAGFLMTYSDADGTNHQVSYLKVPPAGFTGRALNILSNENFNGPATITLTFTWYKALRGSASSHTAVDYFRVAPPAIVISAVGFSGRGYVEMLKNSSGDPAAAYTNATMTFADNGSAAVGWRLDWSLRNPLHGDSHLWHYVASPISNPPRRDPACFAGNAKPRVAVLVRVSTAFPIPTLRIFGKLLGATAVGIVGSVKGGSSYRIVELSPSPTVSAQVYNSTITWNWYYDLSAGAIVPLGATDHQIFLTYATPFVDVGKAGIPPGTTVTARRVDWCTQLADGTRTPAEIGSKVGPDAIKGGRFYAHNSIFGNLTTAWQIMDGTNADCGSLCTLMKSELDMLGATGSKVQFVYACHQDWSHLYSQSPLANETNAGGVMLGMYFGSRHHNVGSDLAPLPLGFNNYEGCCEFQGKWWMGGLSRHNPQPSAEAVLGYVVEPNQDGTVEDHQCYLNDLETHVSLPSGSP